MSPDFVLLSQINLLIVLAKQLEVEKNKTEPLEAKMKQLEEEVAKVKQENEEQKALVEDFTIRSLASQKEIAVLEERLKVADVERKRLEEELSNASVLKQLAGNLADKSSEVL